jgi:hypothetical protein
MKIISLLVLVVLIVPCVAQIPQIDPFHQVRSAFDGNTLNERCKSNNRVDVGLCEGYIMGVSEASNNWRGMSHEWMKTWKASNFVAWQKYGTDIQEICMDVGVTSGQLRDVVIRYLEQHPEIRHHAGEELVETALFEAFHCQ